jgi:CO/xanthine dehydrogenase Mo-binding subunit
MYAGDIKLPGMLFAKILTSPYAHAAIKSMDVSKAEALHGVRYILRYDDPDMYRENDAWGVGWPVPGVAYFEGAPVGAVVCADSEEICEEALKLIDIEWEERDFILDWEKATEDSAPLAKPELNPDSNIVTPRSPLSTKQGDVEAGFSEADGIIEFHGIRQEHTWAGVEPHTVTAKWDGDYLEIWVKYQRPYHIKATASAKWFNIPVSRIKVHMPYSGGMFGGWSWVPCNILYHYVPCLLAQRTGKPVKFIYNSHFCGCSLDLISANFKVGYKNDGTITAVEMKNKLGPDAVWNGALHLLENTRIPNVYCEPVAAYVNRGPAVSMRCEQLPHTMCLNLIFGHVAGALNMDPTEVALKNDGVEGQDMTYLSEFKLEHGFPDIDSLKECLNAGKAAIDWDNKWHLPGTKQLPNGKMHGIAMAWTHEWDSCRVQVQQEYLLKEMAR